MVSKAGRVERVLNARLWTTLERTGAEWSVVGCKVVAVWLSARSVLAACARPRSEAGSGGAQIPVAAAALSNPMVRRYGVLRRSGCREE